MAEHQGLCAEPRSGRYAESGVDDDAEALQALKALLTPRLAEANAGQFAAATAEDVKREARVRQRRK